MSSASVVISANFNCSFSILQPREALILIAEGDHVRKENDGN